MLTSQKASLGPRPCWAEAGGDGSVFERLYQAALQQDWTLARRFWWVLSTVRNTGTGESYDVPDPLSIGGEQEECCQA